MTLIRRLFILALIVLCGWFYWQNVKLQEDNARLRLDVAAAKKELAKLHKPLVVKGVAAHTPAQLAQIHLTRAENAFDRKDYATAIRNVDLAQADIRDASAQTTAEGQSALKSVKTNLTELKQRIESAGGNWLTPPSSKKANNEVR